MRQFLVIKRANFPTRLPITGTLVMVMFLDYYNLPLWVWVIVGLVCLGRWVTVAYRLRYQKEYDLFPESVRDLEEYKPSRFAKIIRESAE